VADSNKPGETTFTAYPCDLKGNRLQPGDSPIPVFRDLYSGKTYALIAENIPSAPDVVSQQAAEAIRALKPLHFVSDDASVKGWFIEAPSFDQSADGDVAPAPAPVAPSGLASLPSAVRNLLK
jgi:hypothetical protein